MKKLYYLLALVAIPTFAISQTLINTSLIETKTAAELTAASSGFIQAQFGADFYKITYTTEDLEGQPDTASGALIVPQAPGYALPILVDQHGTIGSKQAVPSNGNYGLGQVASALGAVVMMPDLLGLGESRGFHPFVHAESEASASVDMLFAVLSFLEGGEVAHNGQLFISGYSQGGHSSAAMHREIEENYTDEFTVTAAAHMSGPYSVSGEMKKIILAEENYPVPGFFPYTYLSMNMAYGLYDDTEQFFKQPYAGWVDKFATWEITLDSLNVLMINQLMADHGKTWPKLALQDSVVQILEGQPDHPVNQALADNDLVDWVPQAPTRLIYCAADEIVPGRNSVVADSIMNENGAEDVEAINALPTGTHGSCVIPALLQMKTLFDQFLMISTGTLDPSLPEVVLFPNPASDFIEVRNIPDGTMAELFSLDGRRVAAAVLNGGADRLPITGVESGLYVLLLQSDQGRLSQRIMVK